VKVPVLCLVVLEINGSKVMKLLIYYEIFFIPITKKEVIESAHLYSVLK
jgi:hypothetical protein